MPPPGRLVVYEDLTNRRPEEGNVRTPQLNRRLSVGSDRTRTRRNTCGIIGSGLERLRRPGKPCRIFRAVSRRTLLSTRVGFMLLPRQRKDLVGAHFYVAGPPQPCDDIGASAPTLSGGDLHQPRRVAVDLEIDFGVRKYTEFLSNLNWNCYLTFGCHPHSNTSASNTVRAAAATATSSFTLYPTPSTCAHHPGWPGNDGTCRCVQLRTCRVQPPYSVRGKQGLCDLIQGPEATYVRFEIQGIGKQTQGSKCSHAVFIRARTSSKRGCPSSFRKIVLCFEM
jgi:hypothetical protein